MDMSMCSCHGSCFSRTPSRDSRAGKAGSSSSSVSVACFSCGQPGHHSRDCPSKASLNRDPTLATLPHSLNQPSTTHNAAAAAAAQPMPAQSSTHDIVVNMGSTAADAQKRIKQLLILLTPDEQSLSHLSLSLLADLRTHALSDFLVSTLMHCVKCMPQKSGLFVGLVAALRVQQHKEAGKRGENEGEQDAFIRKLLAQLAHDMGVACKNSAWDEIRLMMRFAAGLGMSGVVRMEDVWQMISTVIGWLKDGARKDGDSDMTDVSTATAATLTPSKRDYLLFTLLSLPPFLAESFDTTEYVSLQRELDEMVVERRRRMVDRNFATDLLAIEAHSHNKKARSNKEREESKMQTEDDQPTINPSSDNLSFDLIDSWHRSISVFKSKLAFLEDASEVSVQRSCYLFLRPALTNMPPLPLHAADHMTLPSSPPPRLRPILRLFPRAALYPPFPLNDLLLADFISDLLTTFEALHKECTKQLLALPLPLSNEARQHGQYLIIESIFENLLTLPQSNVRQVYYGTIFIDLFKAQPNLMPPLVGAALNFLFQQLGRIELECRDRLAHWFSFHLSNFAYVWPWVAWRYAIDQPEWHPQRRFIAQTLECCVRLSYWERIQQTIPEEFLPLMPHQPQPAFRFSAKNVERAMGDLNMQQYYQFSIDLTKIILGKSTAPAVIAWLDTEVAPILGSEARLRLFTPCLLECGNKSYSHAVALFDRYKSVFQTLCTNTTRKKGNEDTTDAAPESLSAFDCQRIILHSLSEYWQHSHQHVVVLASQMYHFNIVSMESIAAWVFFSQRCPAPLTHLWRDLLFVLLRAELNKLDSSIDAIVRKPRAIAMSTSTGAEDEQSIDEKTNAKRELLVRCVANFDKILNEVLNREVKRSKDRDRQEADLAVTIQRFKQFARAFHADLSGCIDQLTGVVSKSSRLHHLISQIQHLV